MKKQVHKLTSKQENFCIAYIKTGNASEAYRQCYNIKKMKPESINRKAKELLDNGKIAARIAELQAPAIKKAQITLEGHLNRLKHLSEQAEASEQFAAAIKAEENRGKVAGFYIDRKEIKHGTLEEATDAELLQIIKSQVEAIENIEGGFKLH